MKVNEEDMNVGMTGICKIIHKITIMAIVYTPMYHKAIVHPTE